MTRDEAVSDIAEAIRRLDSSDVETVALVLHRAIERVNVRMVTARETSGSGWRQGVITELHRQEFPRESTASSA